MAMLKIRTNIDIFKNEKCKVTFGLEYIIVIGRTCDANCHPFGDVRDNITKSLDVCHR